MKYPELQNLQRVSYVNQRLLQEITLEKYADALEAGVAVLLSPLEVARRGTRLRWQFWTEDVANLRIDCHWHHDTRALSSSEVA